VTPQDGVMRDRSEEQQKFRGFREERVGSNLGDGLFSAILGKTGAGGESARNTISVQRHQFRGRLVGVFFRCNEDLAR